MPNLMEPPGRDETYYGYCVACGAAHEIGGELEPSEKGCMCGGQVVDVDLLGRLAHRLWWHWSMSISDDEPLSEERLERWSGLWRPYRHLDDEDKKTDKELVKRLLTDEPYPGE